MQGTAKRRGEGTDPAGGGTALWRLRQERASGKTEKDGGGIVSLAA